MPLALVSVGIGGVWVAQLRALERFYPVFLAVALGAFAYGFYRLYISPAPCDGETACAVPATQRRQRITFWTSLVSARILILSPFLYAAFNS